MNAGFWHNIPIVRLLIPFAIGVGIDMFYPMALLHACLLLFFFLVLLFISVLFKDSVPHINRGVLTVIVFFISGIALHQYQDIRNRDGYFDRKQYAKLIVKTTETMVPKKRSWKVKCEVIGVIDSIGNISIATGKIMLYVQKFADLPPLDYGDRIIISNNFVKETQPPQNPGEFHYKRYLAFQHVHHQVYLRKEQLVKLDGNDGHALVKTIIDIQKYFAATLQKYLKSANEMAVAKALLYGYDDDIDDETVQAYAHTGTLHVLAVSGMHVGIIFMVITKLLLFMDKRRQTRWLKIGIQLLVLWTYSLLCNMSPSILRATVMFSFIVLANGVNRPSNIYNTLAASAFLLIAFDANIIGNVGFQLSYMAVLGIVGLQPLIYKWFIAPGNFIDQVWKITSVSIAAQVSTSPIGLLYFHQFPNCFLFSNLFIIPLTTIILYGCIILVFVSFIPFVAGAIGWLLSLLILITNELVKWVEKIPYAYVEGIQISIPQSILMYLITAMFIGYMLMYHRVYLKLLLGFGLIYVAIFSYTKIKQANQQELTVYKVNNHFAMRILNGTKSYLFADDTLYADKDKMRFHLQQHFWNHGIKTEQVLSNLSQTHLIEVSGKHILLGGDMVVEKDIHALILTKYIEPEKIARINPEMIVIGSSLSVGKTNKLKMILEQMGFKVHAVRDSGAFQLSL